MNREVSIVLSVERRNYRKVAQEWYGLTDEQMVDMDVHHNPPRSQGGRNIPEHLYVYHNTLHGAVHEDDLVTWAREGGKKAHAIKDELGRSILGVNNGERLNQQKDKKGKSLNALKGIARQRETSAGIFSLSPQQLSENAKRIHDEKNEEGKSRHAAKAGRAAHLEKDEQGKSINGLKSADKLNAEKDELGRSVNAIKGAEKSHKKVHADKNEEGKSKHAIKMARASNLVTHSKKDERGKSVHAVKAARMSNAQIWESTVDGFRGRACSVAIHNKSNGWDPGARVKIM